MKIATLVLAALLGGSAAPGQILPPPTLPPAPPTPAVLIGAWMAWQQPCGLGLPGVVCQTTQPSGFWIPIFAGPETVALTITLEYTEATGRQRMATQNIATSPGSWANVIFLTGANARVTKMTATAGMVGAVSATLTANDPHNRGALYYDDGFLTNMAVAATQNNWAYPVGTGVQVTSSFKPTDTESTGILLVANYHDGGNDSFFIPRNDASPVAWIPTKKAVDRPDLYRIVVGDSATFTAPTPTSKFMSSAMREGEGGAQLPQ